MIFRRIDLTESIIEKIEFDQFWTAPFRLCRLRFLSIENPEHETNISGIPKYINWLFTHDSY